MPPRISTMAKIRYTPVNASKPAARKVKPSHFLPNGALHTAARVPNLFALDDKFGLRLTYKLVACSAAVLAFHRKPM